MSGGAFIDPNRRSESYLTSGSHDAVRTVLNVSGHKVGRGSLNIIPFAK